MSYKVSIVTINYNDKLGLSKTIDSVVNQSYDSFEFIVIDGGSSDGSNELIQQNHSKIDYWISENDSGVFNAMNKGIKASHGEYIIFMNAGDCFYDNHVLAKAVSSFDSESVIYYGNNIKKSPSSERLKTYPEKLSFSFFYTSSINHQSTFIKKSLFDDFFYYNENYKIASDWEFFIYAICYKNVRYKYLNQTIAIYDFTGISSNPKSSELFIKEKLITIKKYFPAFENDYKDIAKLTSKRVQQIFYIQKYPIAWKIVKSFISLVLLFLPKPKQ